MPGIPLVARETTNSLCNCSYSRGADQMCRPDSRLHLSPEEEIAAEESLSIYCKPVELYNILQRRAVRNDMVIMIDARQFAYLHHCSSPMAWCSGGDECLQCLASALLRREIISSMSFELLVTDSRIQMTISLSGMPHDGLQTHRLFPLYILLARPDSNFAVGEYSAVFRFSRACILTTFTGVEGMNRAQANFILPEINKLAAEVKSGSLALLFVSCAEVTNSVCAIDPTQNHKDMTSFPSNVEGYCLLGKIPMELLYLSWEKSPNLSLGERAEMMSTVDMHSCFMKLSCMDEDKSVAFQMPSGAVVGSNTPQHVEVLISAEEVGAKEKSLYNSYSNNDIPTSLSHIMRLRTGNVIFNYRYYNNKLQRTEVTEDFSCPFCLLKCASFKVTDEYQAVNVSVKTDIWRPEIVADGVDPKQQTIFFCSKPLRRKKLRSLLQIAKHVHPLLLDSDFPVAVNELRGKADGTCAFLVPYLQFDGIAECAERDTSSPNATGVSTASAQSFADPECVQSVSGSHLAPPTMLQFAKTRKLSIERSDPRKSVTELYCCPISAAYVIAKPSRALLQKRQFFHSHRAQPMELEQALSDRDSEDEVDDDVADFEDRRMLDDFVDVTKDEKQMMHLWNSFVRKQRVLADGHVSWACEAFSKFHGQDLVRAPPLLWCWKLFMIKLWNHGLLDARTMNNCNMILEQCQNLADPMRS
ncbi:hypothetical protein TEA_009832 [Camellia sinensis var. sinensis]|uniref:Uncharacterized protein n=1 Tax=Camellia sinensis var. sinensis TaxID=542762 RepID=A0A4S4DBC9_CAMSN|nr:hypothetical protein TEA_009832 [Camellia sinensis var. sinensis]